MAVNRPITNWDDVPVIIDIPFVMRLFGVSRKTVLKKIHSGELKASKICGGWRIDKSDAIDWFDSQRHVGGTA